MLSDSTPSIGLIEKKKEGLSSPRNGPGSLNVTRASVPFPAVSTRTLRGENEQAVHGT